MANDKCRIAEGKRQMVLTPALIEQLEQKLIEALGYPEAEVTLVVKRGVVRWIRGPTPSEPART
jgi:hypothetical protein